MDFFHLGLFCLIIYANKIINNKIIQAILPLNIAGLLPANIPWIKAKTSNKKA